MENTNSTVDFQSATRRMIQIHRGMGVDADRPLERCLREARVRRIGEGSSEIHLKTMAHNPLKGYEDVDTISLD